MSHSVKRARSKNEQFRMAVPEELRQLAGLTEWTKSLGTMDRVVAAVKRGELITFFKNEVFRLRGIASQNALQLLNRGFDKLARTRGSMDKAITEQLTPLGSVVIDSRQPADELGELQTWGDVSVREPSPHPEPVPLIDDEVDRDIFRQQALLVEGTGRTDGIFYPRLAALLLQRRIFASIRFGVSYMTRVNPSQSSRTRMCTRPSPKPISGD